MSLHSGPLRGEGPWVIEPLNWNLNSLFLYVSPALSSVESRSSDGNLQLTYPQNCHFLVVNYKILLVTSTACLSIPIMTDNDIGIIFSVSSCIMLKDVLIL